MPCYSFAFISSKSMILTTAQVGCFKNKKNLHMAKVSTFSFIKEVREELAKVSWPSRETTIRYTIIVIVGCLIVGAIAGGMDYVLSLLFKTFIF